MKSPGRLQAVWLPLDAMAAPATPPGSEAHDVVVAVPDELYLLPLPSAERVPSNIAASLYSSRESVRRAASTVLDSIRRSRSARAFQCPICLSSEGLTDAFRVAPCRHAFCSGCLGAYVESRIAAGATAIQCPFLGDADRCGTQLCPADVEALITDPEVLRKYERFRALSADPDMRECPQCGHRQRGQPSPPLMTCAECGLQYCFVHGNAHPPDEPCDVYERRCASARTTHWLAQHCKPCPKCGAPSQRKSGCNHLRCPQCGEDWCWLCGESIEVVGGGLYVSHYSPLNSASRCVGMQYVTPETPNRYRLPYYIAPLPRGAVGDDEEESRRGRASRLLFRSPLAVPFYAIGIVIYALATFIALPCLMLNGPYRRRWFGNARDVVLVIVRGIYAAIACVLGVAGVLVMWALGSAAAIVCCPFLYLCDDLDEGLFTDAICLPCVLCSDPD